MMEEEENVAKYAKYLAANLHLYPPEHVIYGDYAYKVWDEKMIKDLFGYLTPRNMRVDVQTKSFTKYLSSSSQRKNSSNEIEPWFRLEYFEEDIPRKWVELWENPPSLDPSLHLPLQNKFIPRDLSRRAERGVFESRKEILEGDVMIFSYELGKSHGLPFVKTEFCITLSGADDNSLRKYLMARLFTLLLKDELNEITYMGNEASLETAIFYVSGRLVLQVNGLVDKLPVYLSELVAVLKSFIPKDDRFRAIKEDMERTLKNAHTKPKDYNNYTLKRVLLSSFWSVEDRLNELSTVSLADLESFIQNLLSKVHIKGQSSGNLLEKEALKILEAFTDNFSDPLEPGMTPTVSMVKLPPSVSRVIDVRAKNELDKNSSVQLYFQIGANTPELYVKAKLFDVLVKEPFYNKLRTKMQLGYEVSSGVRLNHGILGFYFYVQSSKFNPKYLQKRMIAFIKGVQKMLENIDKQAFRNHKSGSVCLLSDIENQECFCETTEVGNRDFGIFSNNPEKLA
ncbi:hypothetical protein OROHE_010386 [Orobanche hederae]